jgi:hypothetical protein
MLGPPKARHVDRPVPAPLDDLVPPGHFSRHLEAALDLSFVREPVRDRYPGLGDPAPRPALGASQPPHAPAALALRRQHGEGVRPLAAHLRQEVPLARPAGELAATFPLLALR